MKKLISFLLSLMLILNIALPFANVCAKESDFVIENGVLVKYNGNDENVIIPDGVTEIGYGAFANRSSLISVDIPNSVAVIGVGAFAGCSSLISMDIPDSVTKIGASAFERCFSLKNIIIPDSVVLIDKFAFMNCYSLESIDIPKNITSISIGAFSHCHSLKTVYISENITSISNSAFYKCSSLTNIFIPETVTFIDEYALAACHNLTVYSKSEYVRNYAIENNLSVASKIDKIFDIDKNHWAYNNCSIALEKGIMNGKSKTEFAPQGNITRAEFCRMVINAVRWGYIQLDEDEIYIGSKDMFDYDINNEYILKDGEYVTDYGIGLVKKRDIAFSDVKKDAWYYNAVMELAKAGYINGVGDGRFNPDAPITRQDIAILISNIKLTPNLNVFDNADEFLKELKDFYKDIDSISDYAKEAMAKCLGVLIKGDDKGYINPKKNMTRAECATLFVNGLFA